MKLAVFGPAEHLFGVLTYHPLVFEYYDNSWEDWTLTAFHLLYSSLPLRFLFTGIVSTGEVKM